MVRQRLAAPVRDDRARLGAVALVVLAIAAALPPSAGALPLPSSTAYVTNGGVSAVAMDASGRSYLGGSFSQVGPRVGHALKLTSSNDQQASGFPDVNGAVTAAVGDGSSGWFIGGDFTAVGGVTRNRLAHVKSDGTLDATWNPSANGPVAALALSGSDLYVGGYFNGANSIGGQARDRIAKLSTTGTGAADATWNPSANGSVLALAVSASDLYVGGFFNGANSIGGQTRNYIAKLSTSGTGAPDATWNPNANNGVLALALSGSDLYVGGVFFGANSIGGQDRNRIAKLSTSGTGAADATWNPNANAPVIALAQSGSDLYVGGNFFGANSIGGEARNRIAKLSTTGTGAADATWNPNASDSVAALAVSGSDLYVGGYFDSIGGQDRNRIAKLSTTGTGTTDATWNPNADNGVAALAVSGSDVFAGGYFASAGSLDLTRNNIARLNPDGTLDTAWDPNANGPVLALAPSGSDLYVGGYFNGANSIGGQARNGIAKLSTTGTGAADATWDPNPDQPAFAFAVSGSDIYVGGFFASIGGQARNNIAKLSTTGTGAADATWNPNPNNGVLALALSGSDLYVGGYFDGANSIGGQARNRIAKLSTTGTGAADATWNPNANANVLALALSGSDLYAGGDFDGANPIGGQARNYIAKLSTTGTGVADATWNPNPNGNVTALALSGSDLYVGGYFDSIGGQARNRIAKLSTTGTGAADAAWDPNLTDAPAAFAASNTRLLVGGSFVAMGPLSTANVALLDLSATQGGGSPGGGSNGGGSGGNHGAGSHGGDSGSTGTGASGVAAAAAVGRETISPFAFPAAPRGPSALSAKRRRYGAKVTFTLNLSARVRFTVQKALSGRRVNGKCVARSRSNRTRPRCTRYVTLTGNFTRSGGAGTNTFRFTGRLNGKRLAPGNYRLVATPSAGGKTGRGATAKFKIVP